MAGLSRSMCPHGSTRSACPICQALDLSELSEGRRSRSTPQRGSGSSLSWTAAKFGIAAIVVLFLVSWVAAFFWAALRIIELVAVAVVAGWICWRLGVRHGRRNPG